MFEKLYGVRHAYRDAVSPIFDAARRSYRDLLAWLCPGIHGPNETQKTLLLAIAIAKTGSPGKHITGLFYFIERCADCQFIVPA